MSTSKVAISIDQRLLRRVDALVRQKAFASRSGLIQQAVAEKLARLDRSRLARECAKLNPRAEQAQADEGLGRDLAEWPEY
jgi:metal-responsive CopG/Arc/MetJ family transcriptional regulator